MDSILDMVARCLRLAATLIGLLAVAVTHSSLAAPSDPVQIGDAALRHCVEQALGKGAGETVTEADMATLERLDCTKRGRQSAVRSLSGLEFAVNLAGLSLGRNAVSDLSPLARLTSLASLDLAINAVSDLSPLANLSALSYLSLVGNAVSDVTPLANLASLSQLWLGANAVSDVTPLANLASLTRLDLGDNAVKTVAPLARLTSLEYLGLYSNSIADVSALRGMTALGEAYLAHNRISDISALAANAGLGAGDHVDLQSNPLDAAAHATHIPALQKRGATVYFNPPTVTIADIADAGLRGCVESALGKAGSAAAISTREMATLTALKCRDAGVVRLSGLEEATSLARLDLHGNAISNVALLGRLTTLTYAGLRDNEVADIAALAANAGLGAGSVVELRGNPLNAAAHATHIPQLQGRGATVHFDAPPSPRGGRGGRRAAPLRGASARQGRRGDRHRGRHGDARAPRLHQARPAERRAQPLGPRVRRQPRRPVARPQRRFGPVAAGAPHVAGPAWTSPSTPSRTFRRWRTCRRSPTCRWWATRSRTWRRWRTSGR